MARVTHEKNVRKDTVTKNPKAGLILKRLTILEVRLSQLEDLEENPHFKKCPESFKIKFHSKQTKNGTEF
jgi:hypothetical protein